MLTLSGKKCLSGVSIMKFWQKRTSLKILIIVLFIGVLVATFLSLSPRKEGPRISKGLNSPSGLFFGKGISFVEYHGDRRIYSASIDSVSIDRAKLGPFAIGPLHVAHLDKVAIDINLDEIEPILEKERVEKQGERGKVLDFENPISKIKEKLPPEARKIRALDIRDVSINLWKEERRILKISSDTASIDRNSGDLIFAGHATMDAGENGKLISHRIRWNRTTRLFRVTDAYIFTKNGKKVEGEGMETDYLFKRMNDQLSNK
jgi:hypothetical protein